MAKARDYKEEYKWHSKPSQIEARSSRNQARAKLEKEGLVRKGDGNDVDHKDSNPKNNSRGNLRVQSKSVNRARNGK